MYPFIILRQKNMTCVSTLDNQYICISLIIKHEDDKIETQEAKFHKVTRSILEGHINSDFSNPEV